jgi:hypothetical protein
MVTELTDEQARELRARSQLYGLRAKRPRTVAGAVERVVGLQAQDLNAASLQLRARTTGLTRTDFEDALGVERSVVRTWCFRRTLHVVPAEDVRWILGVLGNRLVDSTRSRYRELGIDECEVARTDKLIADELARHGPLTRAELFERLNARGISTSGQRGIHLLSHAAFRALVCYGPTRAGRDTFVLMDDWIDAGRSRPPADGPSELARRYLAGYGPATVADFQSWSGLPAADCRAAWENISRDIREVSMGGTAAWVVGAARGRSSGEPSPARLLGAFDPCLLGYKDRSLIVDPEHARKVNTGGGLVRPALVSGGEVVGIWKPLRKKKSVDIRVEPFGKLSREAVASLEVDSADVGRYLGLEPSLEIL